MFLSTVARLSTAFMSGGRCRPGTLCPIATDEGAGSMDPNDISKRRDHMGRAAGEMLRGGPRLSSIEARGTG